MRDAAQRMAELANCPACNAHDYTDNLADLFIRDRVKCRKCGREYARGDMVERLKRQRREVDAAPDRE